MGRVGNRYVWHGGQTENQGEQTKKFFSALRAEFCPPWPETLPAPLQQWIRRKAETPYMTVPQSAADALVSCDEQFFPIVSALLTILLTLPIPSSTASAERSFSTLRRLKTWLRSRMGEDRLTALALLNIHRDIEIDTDSVVDMFAKTKKRLHDFVV